MKVRWTPEAEQDRDDIWTHVAADDPAAAIRLDQRFGVSAAKLAEFPHLGRIGRIAGTREMLPHQSYRLVYEIAGETVWVLALVHAARRWPNMRS